MTDNMVKVKVSGDEWYPVYSIEDYGFVEIEIPLEVRDRISAVHKEFRELQVYLRKEIKKVTGEDEW